MDEIVGKGFNVGGIGILPLPNRKVKAKRIYYHPNTGEPTCLLPADAYHTRLLLRMGFTLEPPIKPPDGNEKQGESKKEETNGFS
jgi:hypothetical protein